MRASEPADIPPIAPGTTGLWHALYIFGFRMWEYGMEHLRLLKKFWLPTGLAHLSGFCFTTTWVMLGWVFFRSGDLEQAFTMLTSLAHADRYTSKLNLHPN